MRCLFVLVALILAVNGFSDAFFQPHVNKHHVYRTCGESLNRRVSFLCNGGIIQADILNTLDCCSMGCTDRQLYSWCEYSKLRTSSRIKGIFFRDLIILHGGNV
ncbi:hypothetical protein L5515_013738 [Caenorhabditis briggsae]|uniref:Uncharacterized protein n=1 Tax=Caenorhabditis briggsae TaxID=6238 RepID=A0AAE9E930_CAEBR|nr:hypothetical protein L5515_013738 [Caenorhabditis briggsae]